MKIIKLIDNATNNVERFFLEKDIKNSFATFENVKTGDVFRRVMFYTKDTEWCVVDTEYFSGKILPM